MFNDATFGNCYTFNYFTNRTSKKAGPLYGMQHYSSFSNNYLLPRMSVLRSPSHLITINGFRLKYELVIFQDSKLLHL